LHYAEATRTLCRALAMWHGRALANVEAGKKLSHHAVRLDEARNRALELRIEVDLRCGRHQDLVAELRALAAASPLNEWLHLRLIESLYRSGRRHEALAAFQRLRVILRDELGLEPSREAHHLQREILSSDGAPAFNE
jgi:DNA-binding SARP family transcriptional activator